MRPTATSSLLFGSATYVLRGRRVLDGPMDATDSLLVLRALGKVTAFAAVGVVCATLEAFDNLVGRGIDDGVVGRARPVIVTGEMTLFGGPMEALRNRGKPDWILSRRNRDGVSDAARFRGSGMLRGGC